MKNFDFLDNTEILHFEDRDKFDKACDEYHNNPRLIDIGYADMIITLQKSSNSQLT